jgi:hypothetical protein
MKPIPVKNKHGKILYWLYHKDDIKDILKEEREEKRKLKNTTPSKHGVKLPNIKMPKFI